MHVKCLVYVSGICAQKLKHRSLHPLQGWANVLFKRMQHSHILLCSFQKNEAFSRSFAFFIKRPLHSFHSFKFFKKERCVLCVLLRSSKKNMAFFAFFYVVYKRTRHSLRSFTFFIKDAKERCTLFGFISPTKMTNLAKKRM